MTANEIIQLLGVLYFVFGLAFLLNKKYYLGVFKDLLKSTPFILVGGYIAFVLGFIILLFFNEFSLSKEGLVTVLGLITLIKGVMLLVFPKKYINFAKNIITKKNFNTMTILLILISLALMFIGYIL